MTSKIALLRDEITNDPLALGYTGMTDQQISDSLNAVNINVDRDTVPTGEILAAIVPADFVAIADATRRTYLQMLLATDSVPLGSVNIRNALQNIFSGRTDTLNALSALQQETISRARQLGIGTAHSGDIGKARST